MSIKYRFVLFVFLAVLFYFSLPATLFNAPRATLLLDRNEALLSARIAEDEQWRFPSIAVVPNKLKQCLLLFEDEYFYYHPGVNPVSTCRALLQNLSSREIKSGGSTISMQVIRLARNNPKRSYIEKLKEMVLALRLEFSYSKEDILKLYTSNAPYGGNIVGVETAAWRYFKRPPEQLSWSESAMLTVLPNAPSLIHLGKNRNKLELKRNTLLKKLLQKQVIDSLTYSLAIMEAIPEEPKALPNDAFHLLSQSIVKGDKGKRIKTTLDKALQIKTQHNLDRYMKLMAQNEIHNGCALIVSLKNQEVLAYVGNTKIPQTRAPFVDLIQAPRSSGSTLKPILYGLAVSKGMLHPNSLLKDIPINIDQFSPKNFDGEYEGLITAGKALSKSLNIPATILLKDYGITPFHSDLKNFGFATVNRSANDYGLSLILGGAEVTLWDLARFYAYQGQKITNGTHNNILHYKTEPRTVHPNPPIKAINEGAWWLITEALTEVQRPGINSDWKKYTNEKKIAWKTGTSHGFRDAWAVGYNKDFLVAVWLGNADGEGRPGLTGVSAAGPLLFDLFQLLPASSWFDTPEYHLKNQTLCKESGYLPTPFCPTHVVQLPVKANMYESCRFHKKVLLNNQSEIVYRDCVYTPVKDTTIFKIDAVTSYYFQKKNKNSFKYFPTAENCLKLTNELVGIVYPTPNSKLIIPKNFKGTFEKVVFKAHHKNSNQTLFWHLNNNYLGSTTELHEMTVSLEAGPQHLLVMDKNGNTAQTKFKSFLDLQPQ